MPKIIIGVPTYNGAARVNELLASIELRTPLLASGDVTIVVVDDGSPHPGKTWDIVHKFQQRGLPLLYSEHQKNRGISAGWNTATRTRENDITVLINDDVIVPTGGWLEALVHVLEHSPNVGGVGVNWHAFLDEDVQQLLAGPDSDLAVVPRDPGTKKPTPVRRDYEGGNAGRVMCPGGQLFAFRRKDFDALGGFDEGMKSFYEESQFGTAMAAKLGKIGLQLNWPMCWHRWSATFSANPELHPSERMKISRQRYIENWQIPAKFQTHVAGHNVFDYTNPKYLGAIGDVEVEFIRKDGTIARGTLRQNGAFDAR